MCPPVYRIDTVSKAVNGLGEAFIVLKRNFNNGAVCRFGDVDRSAMADSAVAVQVPNKASDSTLEEEGLFAVAPFVLKAYFQSLVQVGHLSQVLAHAVKIVGDFAEYLLIGKKGNCRASITGLTNLSNLSLGYTLPVFLLIQLAITPDISPKA